MPPYLKSLVPLPFGCRRSPNAGKRDAILTRSAVTRSGASQGKCVDCKKCCKSMKLFRPSGPNIQRWCDACGVKIHAKDTSYACSDCSSDMCRLCGEKEKTQRPIAPVQPVGDDEFIDDDQLCVICMDAQDGAALVPCGHSKFCLACASSLDTCPLCRQEVQLSSEDQMLRIHLEGMKVHSDGQTGMHDAASKGDVRRLNEYLTCGVAVDLKCSENMPTPLELAIYNGHANAVSRLLAAGASVNSQRRGQTSLHKAAQNGHDAIVQLLLASGCHVDATDLEKMTALHWAARMGHEKVAVALLCARADLNAKSIHGYTPLAMADDWGTASMTRLLRERGAVR